MKLLIDNQNFIIEAFILVVVILMTVITVGSAAITNTTESSVEKVEVYHFHPTHGCYTCTTMGKNAEDTIKTYFPNELESRKIIFDHINFQDPANAELVKKYEVSGSSLMIGVYDQNGFHKEENIKVWYLAGKKDESMTYLKELIKKRLAGDFSE
ncbi:MAG TPA: nitrophenyl compound nitroreductase subunit ArsF family protein [Methanospirillum sp.]|uniref:nitrophenyl compound nitroreductase subunit ArsF family protein n=1 Tax=Methanospirillum sp. TaxID=45200 RepID=UPI002B9D4DD9|nr:nitrophenyl compound nitroreductase subunit ArsF family protein [Methanospirillum sp.]HOJ95368.1 nitrophenyl compound nitroreductase subunit ArsF family protein [Methanospirillum sp.]HPP76849.1 nitrophenyl compound nitroreductase subunit ArsF family protein [Methanospirillum sp.]